MPTPGETVAYAGPMQDVFSELGLTAATQSKIVASILAVSILILLRWVTVRAIHRRLEDPELTYRTRKVATYVTSLVVALTLSWIWIDALDSFPTYLGLVSAGVAIALTDVLKNLAGWAYILLRRPFRVGDRIEIGETKGDVVDVRLFRFSLLEIGNWVDAEQSTGRLVHVPNGLLFSERLANYTEGFEYIWHEIPVLITFESDWHKARAVLEETLRERIPAVESAAAQRIRTTAQSYHIRFGTLTPRVYLTVRDSGVLLTARLLVDVRARRAMDEAFWEGVLERFAEEPTIDLAYPTLRMYRPE